MCLYAGSQRVEGDRVPRRRRAYKAVIPRTREALVHGGTYYKDGSVHSIHRSHVMRSRRKGTYYRGFHVITDLSTAQKYAQDHYGVLIEVEVTPARWVADGNGGRYGSRSHQAVYTGLKVIGRVKRAR